MKTVTEDEFYKALTEWNTILLLERKMYGDINNDDFVYSENDVILAIHRVRKGVSTYEIA